MYWFANRELYVPHETMIEMIVESTSNFNNVHGVVDNNNNSYSNMVIDVMRINQGYASECPIIDEEPKTYTTMFVDLLKDSNKPLGMSAQIIINY